MFQTMGFHWENLGYDSAKTFVDLMYQSEGEHLKAFAAFVRANGLVPHLKNLDSAKFARDYNGPGYAQKMILETPASSILYLRSSILKKSPSLPLALSVSAGRTCKG